MGIKLFVEKKTCPKCNNGILLPYAWKTCEAHTPNKRKNLSLTTSQINRALYSHLTFHCNKAKALESEYLMYDDETMSIIGYRNPIFKMKE